MEQYRRRPMFSVVPQERHRFGSFPFETGTIILFNSSFMFHPPHDGNLFPTGGVSPFRAAGEKGMILYHS
jgi:hypothetical protein